MDPARLRHQVLVPVRFRDMDAMGHVNHAVYFSYMEYARQEFWFQLMADRGVRAFNFIVLKAECLYRSPAEIGETVVVRSGITRMGGSSFTWEYRLTDHATGREIALASTELVMYDYDSGKPTRIPQELRDRLESFQASLQEPA